MRKWFSMLACSALLSAGPCALDELSLAVDPGFGDRDTFVGVEFDFGDLDFVVPITSLGN